jgi:hypothetical protein
MSSAVISEFRPAAIHPMTGPPPGVAVGATSAALPKMPFQTGEITICKMPTCWLDPWNRRGRKNSYRAQLA